MKNKLALCGLALALGLSACSADSNKTSTTTITGTAMSGLLDGATLNVYNDEGALLAGPVDVASGAFSVDIPNSAFDDSIILETSDGSYVDEATGDTVTISGTGLSVAIRGTKLKNQGTVAITPESTVLRYAAENWTGANAKALSTDAAAAPQAHLWHDIADAASAFESEFTWTSDSSIAPVAATAADDAASDDAKLAGFRGAAFSQLASDLYDDPTQQMALLQGLGKDLSDGALDGQMDSTNIKVNGTKLTADLGPRFGQAMMNLLSNSRHLVGLASDDLETLPFGLTYVTDSYIVTYVEGSMSAASGITSFQIQVTDHSGDAVSGISLTLKPTMHMASYSHATPVETCSQSSSDSTTWDCVMYYLMPSAMSGASMGIWELDVKVAKDGAKETATFYPEVSMSMGDDDVRVDLKGYGSDKIANMSGSTDKRGYFIFKYSAGTSMAKFFVAAKESMTSFPALIAGDTLNSGTDYELAVDSVTLKCRLNGSSMWMTASTDGAGHYTCMVSLTSGETNDVEVQLWVNGLLKTTDGASAADGDDTSYTTMTLTPSSM